MKRLFILLTFMVGALNVHAQGSLGEGNAQLNGGFGLSSFGTPVYLGFDYGIHPDVTIGGQLSYRNYSQRVLGNDFDQDLIVISANGNYHFNTILEIPSEIDFYAGLSIGYYLWSDRAEYFGNRYGRASGIGVTAQVGGRYFFTNKLGVNVEFGGGTATGGKVGLTLKL